MIKDISNLNFKRQIVELDHLYGPRLHILNNPVIATQLAKLCHESCVQPEFNRLILKLYDHLIYAALNTIFPLVQDHCQTRMKQFHPEGEFENQEIDHDSKVILTGLARAGTLPNYHLFEVLHDFLRPTNIRQDHINISRVADAQGHVTGVSMTGSKIGGDKDQSIVIIPDPMGATGSTVKHVYDFYENSIQGQAKLYIGLQLITTPEYVQRILKECPKIHLFCLRFDRGLSEAKILDSKIGQYPDKEKGLNEHSYIVPGAGGIGELMNNSFC